MRSVNLKDVLGIDTPRYTVHENGDIISEYSNGKKRKLIPAISKRGKGYLYVSISDNGRVKKYYVHQLVAKAFISNPESKIEVNHIDCNTMNNHVSNLEWATHSENIKHAWGSGMMDHRITNPNRGESMYNSRLTEQDVVSIRGVYNTGDTSYREIANDYGVAYSTIQSIINRKSWKHI